MLVLGGLLFFKPESKNELLANSTDLSRLAEQTPVNAVAAQKYREQYSRRGLAEPSDHRQSQLGELSAEAFMEPSEEDAGEVVENPFAQIEAAGASSNPFGSDVNTSREGRAENPFANAVALVDPAVQQRIMQTAHEEEQQVEQEAGNPFAFPPDQQTDQKKAPVPREAKTAKPNNPAAQPENTLKKEAVAPVANPFGQFDFGPHQEKPETNQTQQAVPARRSWTSQPLPIPGKGDNPFFTRKEADQMPIETNPARNQTQQAQSQSAVQSLEELRPLEPTPNKNQYEPSTFAQQQTAPGRNLFEQRTPQVPEKLPQQQIDYRQHVQTTPQRDRFEQDRIPVAVPIEQTILVNNEDPFPTTTEPAQTALRPEAPAFTTTQSQSEQAAFFQEAPNKPQAPEGHVTIYEVQPGDSYWRISRLKYGTIKYFAAIAEYNKQRIPNPKHLRPGMKVMLPEAEVLEQTYPKFFHNSGAGVTSKQQETLPQGFFFDRNGTPKYRIGSDDTLTDIAKNHLGRTTRWTQIFEMNRNVLQSPDRLKIGTVITLPADASRISVAPVRAGNR